MNMRPNDTVNQADAHNKGREQARERFLSLRNDHGKSHEETMQRLNWRVVELARALNVSGTSLQGFLRDTAMLHGFADQLSDLRFVTQPEPTEEEILRF